MSPVEETRVQRCNFRKCEHETIQVLGEMSGLSHALVKLRSLRGVFWARKSQKLETQIQSRFLYGRRVSTSFLDLVFGAMMKQACRQTLKSLAAECLVGVRLGLLNS